MATTYREKQIGSLKKIETIFTCIVKLYSLLWLDVQKSGSRKKKLVHQLISASSLPSFDLYRHIYLTIITHNHHHLLFCFENFSFFPLLSLPFAFTSRTRRMWKEIRIENSDHRGKRFILVEAKLRRGEELLKVNKYNIHGL